MLVTDMCSQFALSQDEHWNFFVSISFLWSRPEFKWFYVNDEHGDIAKIFVTVKYTLGWRCRHWNSIFTHERTLKYSRYLNECWIFNGHTIRIWNHSIVFKAAEKIMKVELLRHFSYDKTWSWKAFYENFIANSTKEKFNFWKSD